MKRQRNLLFGPGAVKVRLIDKRNKVYFLPLDPCTINKLTGSIAEVLQSQCIKCGKSFANEQGLGGHLR